MMLLPAMLVLASGVQAQTPELDPALVSNTGQEAGSDLTPAAGRNTFAQYFATGKHPDGYFLTSVEVGLGAADRVTADVELWSTDRDNIIRVEHNNRSIDGAGSFDAPQGRLMTFAGPSGIDGDASTLERFTTNDVLLLPDTVYWIVVRRTGGAEDGLSVATASSPGAVDAGGPAGFSLGGKVWSRLGPDGAGYHDAVDASMKIRLRGSQAARPPGPYVTNRTEQPRAAAAETGPSATRYATSFTPRITFGAFGAGPSTFQLTSVLLSVAAEAGVSPRVAIHTSQRGSPAPSPLSNGTLTAPVNVSRILGSPGRAEFTADTPITLNANTTYWVVLDAGSGSGKLSVGTTTSNKEDRVFHHTGYTDNPWIVGPTMQAYNGSRWSSDGRSFRMALNGTTSVQEVHEALFMGLAQVGVGVVAQIEDFNGRVRNESWQWQRGETGDGTFTDIPAEQGGTVGVYVPAAADLGKWLKANVSYDDPFGTRKSLSVVSSQPVLSRPSVSTAGRHQVLGYVLSPKSSEESVNIAQAFTTGEELPGYVLGALRYGLGTDTTTTAISWTLYADDGGKPAATPLFDSIAVPSGDLDDSRFTFEELVHPGFLLAPNTRYWAVLTGSAVVEGEKPIVDLAAVAEWGWNLFLRIDGPTAELDPGGEAGWSLAVPALTSLKNLTAPDWIGHAIAVEVDGISVLRMSVVTHPVVEASFEESTHTVAESDDASTPATEENRVTVTVTLSADPERTVTIPITKTHRGGATGDDYSVPENVVFNAGETEKTFTFTAEDDDVDDDGESVLLAFGTLPVGVNAGTTTETTVSITDDDDPRVGVSFGAAGYSVEESDDAGTTEDKENEAVVTVTLSADPERTVTIPITKTNQGGASGDDYSGVPENVVFNSGETSKTFTFTAEDDDVDDDDESVKLAFGALPARVSEGATNETTVSIAAAADPRVTVSFGAATYSVGESDDASTTQSKENEVVVTVTLSADPERTVTVPITKANQGGASTADYSGVPQTITFNSGETSKSFTFTAAADDESVKLTFGTLPARVSEGATNDTTVTITDDDDPRVSVSFGAAAHGVEESDDAGTTEDKENEAVVTVTLSADPERTVTIPITKANQGGASGDDYSGVPENVVFNAGQTSKSFTFTAADDDVDDDDESVLLAFGTLPARVSEGATTETTLTIADDDDPRVTVSFGADSYSVGESDDADHPGGE